MARILVDMDDVIAEFNDFVIEIMREKFPNVTPTPERERRTYEVVEYYPEELREEVRRIYNEAGFFLRLPLIEGAKEGLEELARNNHDVRLCTSPLLSNPTCAADKYTWADNKLGRYWSSRVIVTRDKTVVRGDILIDDKASVIGSMEPEWTHVLYDQPHNRHVNKPRLTWQNYKKF